MRYQHRLTKYIFRYVSLRKHSYYLILEYQLCNILLFCKFGFSYEQVAQLILGGFVFINGCAITIVQFQVQCLDIIQIYITYIMYSYFIINFNNIIHYIKYIISIFLRLKYTHRSLKYALESGFIKILRHENFNDKILLKLLLCFIDVPSYLELDYLTLSIYILYYPLNIYDLNFFFIIKNNYSFIKMLN